MIYIDIPYCLYWCIMYSYMLPDMTFQVLFSKTFISFHLIHAKLRFMLYWPMKSWWYSALEIAAHYLMEFQTQPRPNQESSHDTGSWSRCQIHEKIFSSSLKSANGLQLVCFGIFLRQGVFCVIRWYSKSTNPMTKQLQLVIIVEHSRTENNMKMGSTA